MLRRLVLFSQVVAVLLVVGWVFLGPLRLSSVCVHCGQVRQTISWQVPLTHITCFHYENIKETPVSKVLATSGRNSHHNHQWLFARASGNGSQPVRGRGRAITQSVAALLLATKSYAPPQLRQELMGDLFHPRQSAIVACLGMRIPPSGFSDSASFETWISHQVEGFNQHFSE
jgi:hypothetical protein